MALVDSLDTISYYLPSNFGKRFGSQKTRLMGRGYQVVKDFKRYVKLF